MNSPVSQRLQLPVDPYEVSGDLWKFGDRWRRWGVLTRVHLGDDVEVSAGTPVVAVGEGEVVMARILRGSEQHRSWGGLVVVEHRGNFQTFYSVYGHVADLRVRVGDAVGVGQQLGEVAGALTAENGWWKVAHLHFGIYTGPWRGAVLPGWYRVERPWRTRLGWWHDPREFVRASSHFYLAKSLRDRGAGVS